MKYAFSALLLAVSLAHAEPSCCEKTEAATDSTSASLYQLDAKWTDQHAKQTTLASFKGKATLITMGYASCTYACPRIVADVLAIEKQLNAAERSQLNVVFVSIDPKNDTPQKLGDFLTAYRVEQTRWHALRGNEDSIRELAAALGVRYRNDGTPTGINHSNLITLLSPTGEILTRLEGLGADSSALVAAIKKSIAAHKS